MSDDDKARLRFELANANMQSIGQAQAKYVTALLTYVCLVWGLFILGGSGMKIDLGSMTLDQEGVWKITPFVTLVLTLAYIGSVTAAMPAFAELQDAVKDLFGTRSFSMFALDTHKNIVDYLARLQLQPYTKTRTSADDAESKQWWRRFHHLILPAIFIGSAITSYTAIRRLTEPASLVVLALSWAFFGVQVLYSARPMLRNVWRFFGAPPEHNVYH